MKKHLVLLGFALSSTPALMAQSAIGNLFSSDAGVHGAVVLSDTGTRILSGSQVSAGEDTAVLKLERGGQVRICPKTNLSLSSDPGGKSLVLGLNAGAMELDYSLHSASDSLITPDFRLQLISPGTFHLAISVAASGDTCLRSLPGNDASVFVAEMMGNESYQLSPGKNVMFKGGAIAGAMEAPPNCGCPGARTVIAPAPEISKPAPPPMEAPPAALTPAPAQHMEVDSSFVFRGNEQVPDFYASVSRLSMAGDDPKLTMALLPQVGSPAEPPKAPEKKPGMLHRFGKFLGRVFGR